MSCLPLVLTFLALVAPPSGRPPSGPLERVDPRVYELRFEVVIATELPYDAGRRENLRLKDTPIVMPVIFQSTYSRVNPDSLVARLWYETREDLSLAQRTRLDSGFPFGTQLAVIPITEFNGQSLRWRLTYNAQAWSSRIDEARAAALTWPREWPDDVRDGLQPQMFIESNHPVFKEAVQKVSGGNLRLVPPYLAAKDLVRYCLAKIQVSGDGVDKRDLRLVHGLEIEGALATVRSGRGGPHDLVCVCVAMLRAAGIPARPIIGVHDDPVSGIAEFISWAEFYLPEAGWIPFDPREMRGGGAIHREVRQPWPDFGTMKNLNDRVPLAFHFIPPASVETPQRPAVWGWDPRPASPASAEQYVSLTLISRGRAATGEPGGGAR